MEDAFRFTPSEELTGLLVRHRRWLWRFLESTRRRRIDAVRGYTPRFGEPVDLGRVRRAVGERLGDLLRERARKRWQADTDMTNIPLVAGQRFAGSVANDVRRALDLAEDHGGDRLLVRLAEELYQIIVGTSTQSMRLLAPPTGARIMADNHGTLTILLVNEEDALMAKG